MKPDTIHKRRLLRLARHLLYGELAHSRFDFNTWNGEWYGSAKSLRTKNVCGFSGCAIGECPRVFPGTFKWNGNDIVSRDGKFNAYESIVQRNYLPTAAEKGLSFFGLTQDEAQFLFIPHARASNFSIIDGTLPAEASRYDVGNHILKFVVKKYGKIRLTAADRTCKELVNPNENVVTA